MPRTVQTHQPSIQADGAHGNVTANSVFISQHHVHTHRSPSHRRPTANSLPTTSPTERKCTRGRGRAGPGAGDSFAEARAPPKAGGESISRTSPRTHKPSALLVLCAKHACKQVGCRSRSVPRCMALMGMAECGRALCAHLLSRECGCADPGVCGLRARGRACRGLLPLPRRGRERRRRRRR
ncbi:hypothetical protein C8T65DRAFT_164724 [Cerioporus squamosus]|nr:hypothetical protein C8T65DRAFT_164724 [Cerioporus squamosus]